MLDSELFRINYRALPQKMAHFFETRSSDSAAPNITAPMHGTDMAFPAIRI